LGPISLPIANSISVSASLFDRSAGLPLWTGLKRVLVPISRIRGLPLRFFVIFSLIYAALLTATMAGGTIA